MTHRQETFLNRDFILALLGYFFLFMSVTLFFLFPIFLAQFHPSKSQVGLIMGIHSITAICVRPFFGRRIDVRGGKKISLIGILLLVALIPWFHLVKNAGILPLLLRALTGVGWGIGMTATMAICSDLAPIERLAHSIGLIGVAGIISSALGPLLAEEIVDRFGFGGVFNASLIFLVAALICMCLTREVIKPNHSKSHFSSDALKKFSGSAILIISTMPVFHGAVRGAVVNFIALFGKSVSFSRVGPFFLAFSLAAIITRIGIGDLSDRYGRKKVIFPGACIISLNLFWISQVQSYWVFNLNGFIAGLGQGLIFPALSTYIIDILGRENKGLALSLYLSLFDVGMGIGSPFFGWISDLYGYRKMYIVAGLLLLVSTIVFTIKAPHPPDHG
ncbi:MAG: MFS transporter [Candidatus Aminicenantales bacterium]